MPIHPRRILWPTDCSQLSLKGLEYGRVFCDIFKAELYVIHVAPLIVFDSSFAMMTAGDAPVGVTDTVAPAKEALQQLLRTELGEVEQNVHSHVTAGNAWYEICRFARDNQIDLIILATHGATGFRHLLMGSTAERVVQHAACPVLTVKSFEREFLEADPAPNPPRDR